MTDSSAEQCTEIMHYVQPSLCDVCSLLPVTDSEATEENLLDLQRNLARNKSTVQVMYPIQQIKSVCERTYTDWGG